MLARIKHLWKLATDRSYRNERIVTAFMLYNGTREEYVRVAHGWIGDNGFNGPREFVMMYTSYKPDELCKHLKEDEIPQRYRMGREALHELREAINQHSPDDSLYENLMFLPVSITVQHGWVKNVDVDFVNGERV